MAPSLGVFSFFNAKQFIAQLSNVYARSKKAAAVLMVCGCCEFSHHRTTIFPRYHDYRRSLIEPIFSIEPAEVDRVRST